MSRPIIGAVSYLNTKPLVAGMAEVGGAFDWVYDIPSRLAERLKAGELTAALVPIVEAANPDYTIVSNACIACRGPVRSVKLLGRVAPDKTKSLALDEGSRTSRILAQVLLAKRFNVRPATTCLKMEADWRNTSTDAVLVIGDRAMNIDPCGFEFCWDLGQEWQQWIELPFVFAVWAAHRSGPISELDWVLSTSRDAGLENLEKIAARYAADYQLTVDECYTYLGQQLHFELGAAERMGAELFFKFARELRLLDQAELNFHECSNA